MRKRTTSKRTPSKRAATRSTAEPSRVFSGRPADAAGGDPSSPASRTPIVGVGASAGGLEAFSQLLEGLQPDTGMAFVLVQHLAPQHESALPVLLGGLTAMPVMQVRSGMHVEPNHVYVIPPNAQLALVNGALRLSRRSERDHFTPIDFFFRSLARAARDRAIAVVLSGTASDGAAGLQEVKAAGGITFAQRPDTARYDGMPRAAIATGLVDLVLTPNEIGAELSRIARHPYVRREVAPEADVTEAHVAGSGERTTVSEDDLQRIFSLLRNVTSVDFRAYKLPTILRRLQRRMALHRLTRVAQYLELLEADPGEARLLYQDILIHVTRFFREPDSFDVLRTRVIPEICARRSADEPIRAWVAGCATGEEAYSLAITLLEATGGDTDRIPLQVFATDISETAIELARNGSYPASTAGDVSPERLRRFFVKTDRGLRVTKAVRDVCVFARQDLTRDPPFSKLDLVLCRNVLIYLGAPLQRRLMSIFHYALKPGGYLMLGQAETIGSHADLFAVLDKRNRIYVRKAAATGTDLGFSLGNAALRPSRRGRKAGAEQTDSSSLQEAAERVILDRYAPPGVVVDGELQIVQFRGQTGPFLEAAPGNASHSLLKMAREGLLYGLRSAIHGARQRHEPVRRTGLRVRQNGGWRDVDIAVYPFQSADQPHFLVLFESAESSASSDEAAAATPAAGRRRATKARPAEEARVSRLQQELAASREYLQSIIQEVEAANEELQSANEEILSSNEELQSTNEELDTAKEELQSTNEELNTLNEELHSRNDELARVNSDLINLLGSVEIAIVIVANDLRIRRFTPMAEQVLNLIPADVGRPIGQIQPNIDCPHLERLITEVVDRVTPQEVEVQDRQGSWYSLRIRPYKNVDNRIEGAVLSLYDIHATRRHEREIEEARNYVGSLMDAVGHPVALLDRDGAVRAANPALCELLALPRERVEGRRLLDLRGLGWSVPGLEDALRADADPGHETVLRLVHRSDGGRPDAAYSMRLRWIKPNPIAPKTAVLVAIDPSAQERPRD